jgi:hypothetical protein
MDILRTPITDPSAWHGPDFANNESWIDVLTADELAELDAALQSVKERGLEQCSFGPDEFPLPTLSVRLNKIANELENGRGFSLIRGLPVEKYTLDDVRHLYWGMGVYFGRAVSQNIQGDLIADVKDRGIDYSKAEGRGYSSNATLRPHNDGTDAVTLLCLKNPKFGGTSSIASATAIYNQILEDRPEYLDTVYSGFSYYLRKEGASKDPNEVTRAKIPIYSYFKDRLSSRFNPKMIEGAAEKTGEALSDKAQEAIHYMEALANSPEFRLSITFQLGDIQLLNNHSIYHTRESFVDGDTADQQRHLLRLWLYLHNVRELAPDFTDRYNTGVGQGIAVRAAE